MDPCTDVHEDVRLCKCLETIPQHTDASSSCLSSFLGKGREGRIGPGLGDRGGELIALDG